jgi:hypothetical protein
MAALALAAPLAAQGIPENVAARSTVPLAASAPVATTPGAAVERAPSLAPTRENAAVGVRAVARTAAPVAPSLPPESSRSPAMMIVGGATLLVGAVIGGRAGTVVMIVGGAIGLVGLWNFLK